ncbi:hypothetical protein GA0115240_118124 [Streptomyces sp. DvalAA-14]|uniref:hypothetical protein n=1 Tax=unclassified Streptomyces TaxID=2593676 RepID=UPI00081AED3C|nr:MULTISPECIES: hypothetical protein [unclassified Streptomyces]MYS20302.1 hypothetical protein [Streptomyces sp. SID4948]SCD65587.1 hypothetical protein GA0115240_118124 [Streptomyces sp. DvalAA-14]
MADSQQILLDRLAVRVAARTGLDPEAARAAVDEALVRRGPYLLVVRAEASAMAEEAARPIRAAHRSFSAALRRVCAAAVRSPAALPVEAGISSRTREGVRDHGRGLRMAAHHPDLAGLDRLLNALYERPGA